ncbi:predicted protein [Coccidioides posadasii str. Silveira]|uniref:Predicted protein n=2 Tax=Coccidioides posadasii TaxID=199306 RepID=E9D9A8_COCPS|nr:predicted protein [Coccidioides posadasii str. Silveira]KMM70052.1 hypothetical protein CPAG_06364 [Coccidioides posadasii RMSCC 3488]
MRMQEYSMHLGRIYYPARAKVFPWSRLLKQNRCVLRELEEVKEKQTSDAQPMHAFVAYVTPLQRLMKVKGSVSPRKTTYIFETMFHGTGRISTVLSSQASVGLGVRHSAPLVLGSPSLQTSSQGFVATPAQWPQATRTLLFTEYKPNKKCLPSPTLPGKIMRRKSS